jgi:hypothetical protein
MRAVDGRATGDEKCPLSSIPKRNIPSRSVRAMGTRMSHQTTPIARLPSLPPEPPDGNNHPLWMAYIKDEPSHSSFCTALCLAVGRSFRGPLNTHVASSATLNHSTSSECGSEGRTLAHIIFDCKLFSRARDEAQIDNWQVHPSLYDLFELIDGAKQLFKFLYPSRAQTTQDPLASWHP